MQCLVASKKVTVHEPRARVRGYIFALSYVDVLAKAWIEVIWQCSSATKYKDKPYYVRRITVLNVLLQ